jgi:ribosomal protein S18 acetylase RimI-like enzyme
MPAPEARDRSWEPTQGGHRRSILSTEGGRRAGVTDQLASIEKAEATHSIDAILSVFTRNDEDLTHPQTVLAENEWDLWLARDGSEIVGVLLARLLTTSEAAGAGVDNLLIDKNYRRQGLGRALMQAAEAHYGARGLTCMRLAVNVENSIAQALYRSMGYQTIREYVRPRGQQKRFLMEKFLRNYE